MFLSKFKRNFDILFAKEFYNQNVNVTLKLELDSDFEIEIRKGSSIEIERSFKIWV